MMYIILHVGTTYALVGLRHIIVDLKLSFLRHIDQFPWILNQPQDFLCLEATVQGNRLKNQIC